MKRLIAAICCLLCATADAQEAKQTSHTTVGRSRVTITDLGLLPGGSISRGLAINNQPVIIGLATDSSFALQRPFWDANSREIIGFADNFDPASTAVPEHLNNNKEMAGTEAIGQRLFRGIFWNSAGQAFGLPPLDGFNEERVFAHGINNLGQIVGANEDGNFVPHAVFWQNKDTTPLDLGVMGHSYGINDLSNIAGFTSGLGSAMHGFLWRNGNATQLSDLAGQTTSEAFAINNTGRIAGDSGNFPVIWDYDITNNNSVPVIEQLPIPSGFSNATGRAVDDAGDVAGYAGAATINSHAILWRDGVAIDLGVWPGGTYSVANGINDLGQIVGTGTVANDNLDHALLWTVSGGTNTTPSPTLRATTSTRIRVGGSVSVEASFSDPDNGPWSYIIDWGDGSSTSGSVSVAGTIPGISPHVYNIAGNFRMRLSVTDARSATGRSPEIGVRVR